MGAVVVPPPTPVPSLAAQETVTLPLFHPAVFAAGASDAVAAGPVLSSTYEAVAVAVFMLHVLALEPSPMVTALGCTPSAPFGVVSGNVQVAEPVVEVCLGRPATSTHFAVFAVCTTRLTCLPDLA